MNTKLSKLYSETKYSRTERKYLLNHSRYHKVTVKRFHRASRKAAKLSLRNY